MARAQFKAVNGKVRVWLLLPEDEFREIEAMAKESGIAIPDVIKMKIKGFEPRRAA